METSFENVIMKKLSLNKLYFQELYNIDKDDFGYDSLNDDKICE